MLKLPGNLFISARPLATWLGVRDTIAGLVFGRSLHWLSPWAGDLTKDLYSAAGMSGMIGSGFVMLVLYIRKGYSEYGEFKLLTERAW